MKRYRFGFFEIILTKRSKPIKELQELSIKMNALRDAILKELSPILEPLVKLLDRIIRKIIREKGK